MEKHHQRIDRLDLGGDSEVNLLLFLLEDSQHPIPDDENAPIVLVDVLRDATMVNPMIGWCVEQELNGSGKFRTQLGMYRCLVQQDKRFGDNDRCQMKSDDHQWQVEEDRYESIQGTETIGHGDVEERRTVVDRMSCPADTGPGGEPELAVVGEVGKNDTQYNGPDVRWNCEKAEIVPNAVIPRYQCGCQCDTVDQD